MTYRLGFASTLRQARQLVVHGHILVNGKKVDIPSFKVSEGDILSLRENSRKNDLFSQNFISAGNNYSYLSKDKDNFSGKLIKLPTIDEIPVNLKFSKILEFYSKN